MTGAQPLLATAVLAAVAGFPGPTRAAGRADRAPSWPTPVEAGDGAWTRVDPFPVIGPIEGFWGPAADDVWAWSRAKILHWDGRVWSAAERPPESGGVAAVGGLSGGIWVELDVRIPAYSSGCDVFEAREETHFWQRTEEGWKALPAREPLPREATKREAGRLRVDELAHLWSRYRGGRTVPEGVVMAIGFRIGGGHVWAADEEGRWLSRFDGARWTSAVNPTYGTQAIWFASETDGWAVSTHVISRWDGARWMVARAGFTGASAIWGTGLSDVWIVGSGVPLHWDGVRWNEVPLPSPAILGTIGGRGSSDIWASPSYGGEGAAFHWEGTAWRRHVIPALSVPRVHGKDSPLITAVGDGRALVMTGQRVLSWNGRDWIETPGPLAGRLRPPETDGAIVAVSTDADGMTWAVGEEWIGGTPHSVAFRHAAGAWSPSPLPPGTTAVKAVWARDPSDVWLVGAKGLILHWDGQLWNRESSGTDKTLVAVHGAGRLVWIAGEGGISLRRRR